MKTSLKLYKICDCIRNVWSVVILRIWRQEIPTICGSSFKFKVIQQPVTECHVAHAPLCTLELSFIMPSFIQFRNYYDVSCMV